ncbi:MAG: PilZ domain-containing protein [Candidatus Magnetoovum sp. WYHC-5]|nr:PilZ domain-containing protein [Candidatus Magnetoovum sp. WYHC-5]
MDNYTDSGSFVRENVVNEYSRKKENPYDLVLFLQRKLSNWYKTISASTVELRNFPKRVIESAKTIQKICMEDYSFVVGCIHMSQEVNYSVKHPIQTAIICEIIAKELLIESDKRLSLICGAITMNMAMKETQDVLYKQINQPYDDQKEIIYNHPALCINLLKQYGVEDSLWLDTVYQHHENANGYGYPQRLKGRRIVDTARIVNIVDHYLVGISARAYRPALLPQHIIRKLYAERKDPIDKRIIFSLVKTLGIYPPGTYVKLKNNELGVVISNCELEADKPIVYTVLRSNGKLPSSPIKRDTAISEYTVVEVIPPDNFKVGINPYLLWGYGAFKQNKYCRRKFKRVKTKIAATIIEKKSHLKSEVVLINMSEGGCLIRAERGVANGINIDSLYYMDMTLMNKVLKNIQCRIRHYKELDGAVLFGTSFVQLEAGVREFIKMFLDRAYTTI